MVKNLLLFGDKDPKNVITASKSSLKFAVPYELATLPLDFSQFLLGIGHS